MRKEENGFIFILVVSFFSFVCFSHCLEWLERQQGTQVLVKISSAPVVLGEKSPLAPEFVKGEIIVKFKNNTAANIDQKLSAKISREKKAGLLDAPVTEEVTLAGTEIKNAAVFSRNTLNKYQVERLVAADAKQKAVQLVREGNKADAASSLQDVYRVVLQDKNGNIDQAVADFQNDPNIEYAEPNYIIKKAYAPNDPYYRDSYPDATYYRLPDWNPPYDYQWDMKKINAEAAWDKTVSGMTTVLVAQIDTGVDYTHPELGGCTLIDVNAGNCAKIAPGYDFINNDNDPYDDDGHGTHVAGTILARQNDGVGIAGMANNARIIPLKVLNGEGNGTVISVASGINEAVTRGAKIINASLAGKISNITITNAVNNAYQNGLLIIGSAGNYNEDVSQYALCNVDCGSGDAAECVVCISATDQADQKAGYSNWGAGIDLAAPGGDSTNNVLSLKASQANAGLYDFVGNRHARMSGTSMSAPHVAGLAALIWGKNPALTLTQVRNILYSSADDLGPTGRDAQFGHGRINAGRALAQLDPPTPTPTPTRIPTPTPTIPVPTITTAPACLNGGWGNLNCDPAGKIDEMDLSFMLGKWRSNPSDPPISGIPSGFHSPDIYPPAPNGDNLVNESDLMILISHWRP